MGFTTHGVCSEGNKQEVFMARYLTVFFALFLLQPACTTDFHGDTDGDAEEDGDNDTEADGVDADADPVADPDALDVPDDGDEPDGTPTCENDGDCSDGNDCNGRETCDLDSGECRPGEPEPDGFVCLGDPRSICLDGECVASECGDGFTDTGAGEFCDPPGEGTCLEGCVLGCEGDGDCADDGNPCNGEEVCDMTDHVCDRTSPPEEGAECGADPRRICLSGSCQDSICGDAWVDGGADPAEECDDDNTVQGDGCDNDCTFSCHNPDECQDGLICNGVEQCSASHVCEPGSNAASGTACEDDGVSCTNDVCNGSGECEHPIDSGACRIGDLCFGVGDPNPDNACQECRPVDLQTDWSARPDGTPCPADANPCTDDFCDAGACTHPTLPVLRGVKQVALGDMHVCALMDDDMTIKCWGAGWAGQLGTGSATGSYIPANVDRSAFGTRSVVMIDSGGYHSCALLSDSTVWCWGSNNDGELGNGTTSDVNPSAGQVPGLTTVLDIGLGANHSCAVVGSTQMYCWGARFDGQCGVQGGASSDDILDPTFVWDTTTGAPMNDALKADGGANHTCALVETDRVRCWGSNSVGQLGDGSTNTHVNPVYVLAPTGYTPHENFSAVTTGTAYTCALNSLTSRAECWGANNYGQLGDGSTTQREIAVVVRNPDSTAMTSVSHISAGFQHTCAVAGGVAKCWGTNTFGQLGVGVGSTGEHYATTVRMSGTGPDMINAMTIDAGYNFTCAIVGTEHELYCWGKDDNGELGNGYPTDDSFHPVAVTCTP
jgi:alpha-tubulin suppressor-like RCC1 family protein